MKKIKKNKIKIKYQRNSLALLLTILLVLSLFISATTIFLSKNNASSPFEIELETSELIINNIKEIPIKIMSKSGFLKTIPESVKVLIVNKGEIVHQETVNIGSENKLSYSIDPTLFTQGKQSFSIIVTDQNDSSIIYSSKDVSIYIDTIFPSLSQTKTSHGNSNIFTTDQKESTPSGIQVRTNKEDTNLTIIFSEDGLFNITNENPTLMLDNLEVNGATVSGSLSSKTNSSSLNYSFTDKAGNTINGIIKYFFDNAPPIINVRPNYTYISNVPEKVDINFTTNEKSSVTATYKGTTVKAVTSSDGLSHNISGFPVVLGDNLINITAIDITGNKSTASTTMTLSEAKYITAPLWDKCTFQDMMDCNGPAKNCSEFQKYKECMATKCSSTVSMMGC